MEKNATLKFSYFVSKSKNKSETFAIQSFAYATIQTVIQNLNNLLLKLSEEK